MSRIEQLTLDPEVEQIVIRLKQEVQTILGDQLIGLYLHGSLATGDFHPESSDLDFCAITATELEIGTVEALRAMHSRLQASDSKWGRKLEGSYIPRQTLSEVHPPTQPRPYVNQEHFSLTQHGDEWLLEKYVLREWGIGVVGPPLKGLIRPITPEELQAATKQLFNNWWLPMVDDSTRLQSSEYQAYAILTMCRILYTLKKGQIVSKRMAAEWVKEEFGQPWTVLIDQALTWREGVELGLLEEVKKLLLFTLDQSSSDCP